MNSDTDFERALRAWIREDAREDPARLLARVAQAVAREPQPRTWTLPGSERLTGSFRIALAAGLTILVVAVTFAVLGSLVIVGPIASPSPTATETPSSVIPTQTPGPTPAPTPAPTIDPSLPALANDEPCTRTGRLDALPPANPFHHEDLERMVLNKDDVGGLPGFEVDQVGQGYWDNAELQSIEVNPDATCEDIQRLGRIEGYGNFYSTFDAASVKFGVHLFWSESGAAEWRQRFVDGLVAAATASGGKVTVDVDPAGVGIADSVLLRHTGPDGVRDWAILQRGPIVGWVVDLHREGNPAIDVPAAAREMAMRIEAVSADVAGRARSGMDVAQLLSAPLPMVAYGDVADGFTWDSFFGGCQDIFERQFIAGAKARQDAITFGRVTGCTAMYVPPSISGSDPDVVRVFSNVTVYATTDGASGALEANITDQESRHGQRFSGRGLGDEAVGIATPGAGGSPADTRLLIRRGNLLLWVSFQGALAPDQRSFVEDLARALDARVGSLGG